MISQETKDQIEKGIWTELDKYFGHQSEQQFERNAAFQIALSLATKYAEKLEEKNKDIGLVMQEYQRFDKQLESKDIELTVWKDTADKFKRLVEEKDKAYNELGVKFDKEVERWQERDANEFEKRRVLEVELAQLKEFQIWFYKKQFGFETDKSTQSNIDSDYAEWCKQNLK